MSPIAGYGQQLLRRSQLARSGSTFMSGNDRRSVKEIRRRMRRVRMLAANEDRWDLRSPSARDIRVETVADHPA
jgi:hypothetical protein